MLIDLSKVTASTNTNTALPDGIYTVNVTGAEVKETKNKDGKYIKAELTIQGGEYAKRKIWHMFNFENKNPKAVEIGLQDLKKMIACAGKKELSQLSDVSQLCGLTVNVKTKTENGYPRVHYFSEAKTKAQDPGDNFPF